jgi:hypothetical protein
MARLLRFGCLILAASSIWAAGRSHVSTSPVPAARGQAALALLPLRFEANQGQWDSSVRYRARSGGLNLSLTQSGPVVAPANAPGLGISLAGSNPAPVIEGLDPLAARTDYFVGARAGWHTGIANYARVRYRAVYPGVDVVYYGNANRLEYDFVLDPGADPRAIRLEFRGALGLRITPGGDLAVDTAAGTLIQQSPAIYQEDPATGARQTVSGRYVLLARNAVGVRLDRYDRKRKLVIDPIIVYSTYFGGTASDQINAVQLSSTGLLYIVGQTTTTDVADQTTSVGFPVVNGAYASANVGGIDAFLAIIDTTANGNYSLVYSSYIGGGGTDIANCVAADANGNIYVGGNTNSADFPVAGNSFKTTAPASVYMSAFVFELNPAIYGASALLYSTYLGGTTGNDTLNGLTLDAAGNIYVIGAARSTDFPVTGSAFATSQYGSQDAFVTELNPNSASLLYSTYIGGQSDDTGVGIVALGPPGQVYVAFNTQSVDFPMAGYSYDNVLSGAVDPVLGLMDLTRSGAGSLVYATYFGGSDLDEVRGIAADAQGNLLVTGYTMSSDFPVTGDSVQSVYGGNGDAFVSVVNPAAAGFILYSTYLGGSDGDVGYAVAGDAAGGIYVTGYTLSGDFPTTINAPQQQWGQGIDAFVTKVARGVAGAAGLQYSTYLGGPNVNVGYALAVTYDGTAYVAGFTEGLWPVSATALQGTYGGGSSDGFVLVLSNY